MKLTTLTEMAVFNGEKKVNYLSPGEHEISFTHPWDMENTWFWINGTDFFFGVRPNLIVNGMYAPTKSWVLSTN